MAQCAEASGDEDCKSTDTSGPDQIVESSSDSSDADDTEFMPNSDQSSVEQDSDWEPSITPQSEPKVREFMVRRKRLTRRRARSEKPLTPDCPVRKPIKAVINALDGWMASNASEVSHQYVEDVSVSNVQSQSIGVLEHALAGLNSREIAMMRVLLDAKIASQ